jgi:phage FluMu protein Com
MQVQSANRQYDPELLRKLALSQMAAEELMKREIKCPACGFYLMDVYGRDHHITRVKCRKCKFNEVIDTALFRTVKPRSVKRVRFSSRKKQTR